MSTDVVRAALAPPSGPGCFPCQGRELDCEAAGEGPAGVRRGVRAKEMKQALDSPRAGGAAVHPRKKVVPK